jgi:hypothetical protein
MSATLNLHHIRAAQQLVNPLNSCGQGRGRTADLPLFRRRTIQQVPTPILDQG